MSTLADHDHSRHLNGVTADELAASASRYVRAGWPVAPVRLPVRASGAAVSVRELVVHVPPADAGAAARCWSQPAGIAALTGVAFDVLAVSGPVGALITAGFTDGAITAARHPDGTWLLPVTPGTPLAERLHGARGVRLHGAGEYVLLPPTPTASGLLTWVAGPLTRGAVGHLELPHSLAVQRAILDALHGHPAAAARRRIIRRRIGGRHR
jgi:hypothetical protein